MCLEWDEARRFPLDIQAEAAHLFRENLRTARVGGLTGFGGKDAHKAREERVNGTQHFGVAACHAGGNASLQGLEVGQDRGRLQHSQQETENLQSGADVGDVGLSWLLLKQRSECAEVNIWTKIMRQHFFFF